jgi:DNA invertase Pin-like site-specific DNA recombinase
VNTAAIYVRVSTADQHVESQLYDLRELAARRGLSVVKEYEDRGISGSKARRPGLDALMADARRKRFDIVLVAAFDRVARNVRHFLEVLDELNHLGIEFVSLRENIDTGGPLGRAMVVIVGAIAQVEKQAIVERVKAGMRRARIEGRQIGRAPLCVDRDAILRDRERGLSLIEVPLIIERHLKNDGFTALVVAAGGLDYADVDSVVGSGVGPAYMPAWNICKIIENPMGEEGAAKIADLLLDHRVAAVAKQLSSTEPFNLAFSTRSPLCQSLTTSWMTFVHVLKRIFRSARSCTYISRLR